MVCVSASVNLPLHHKFQKFSSGTSSPGSSRKKGRKTVVVVVALLALVHVLDMQPLPLPDHAFGIVFPHVCWLDLSYLIVQKTLALSDFLLLGTVSKLDMHQ